MAKPKTQRGGCVLEVEAISVRKDLEFARHESQHPRGAWADDAQPIGLDIFAAGVKTRGRENGVDPLRDKDLCVSKVARSCSHTSVCA